LNLFIILVYYCRTKLWLFGRHHK